MNEKKNPLQDRSLLVGLLALVISLLSGILLFLHVPVLVCAIPCLQEQVHPVRFRFHAEMAKR